MTKHERNLDLQPLIEAYRNITNGGKIHGDEIWQDIKPLILAALDDNQEFAARSVFQTIERKILAESDTTEDLQGNLSLNFDTVIAIGDGYRTTLNAATVEDLKMKRQQIIDNVTKVTASAAAVLPLYDAEIQRRMNGNS